MQQIIQNKKDELDYDNRTIGYDDAKKKQFDLENPDLYKGKMAYLEFKHNLKDYAAATE